MQLRTRVTVAVALLMLCYCLLLIPDADIIPPKPVAGNQFTWDRDTYWRDVESRFVLARSHPGDSSKNYYSSLVHRYTASIEQQLQQNQKSPDTAPTEFEKMLEDFFELSALVAAHAGSFDAYMELYQTIRKNIKQQSIRWHDHDQGDLITYKLLYGLRAAVEEVILQHDAWAYKGVVHLQDEPSSTPSAEIAGIRVHSGDILVSRGGAEVSALISRGNDLPGNFSHVALLYVDEKTGIPYLIESHIEQGVAIATVDEYLQDTKLRFMVLRLRADLDVIRENPMAPHQAALFAFQDAKARHIPYDFKMNYKDPQALFCSEVASYAYEQMGISLWSRLSTITSHGTIRWLSTFGVEHFTTQMPADLEYDKHVSIVAEWRDNETLFKDHIDNAVMDALLTRADEGEEIPYSRWMLPIARVLKGYCLILNAFGKPAIIPEGMSATQALKNNAFVDRYQAVKAKTMTRVQEFIEHNKYRPPYWKMVELAQQSL